MTTLAMIPARVGSTRLKLKNLALLGGRPLISYAVEAAKAAKVFDRIIVNADHGVFRDLAQALGVEFYLRPEALGSSSTRSDEFVYDFMQQHPADVVAWVNSIAPLQTGEEVRAVVQHFHARGLDSLVTVKDEQAHVVYDGKPVNFTQAEPFARTQDLTPVQSFVYSVMMWRTSTFMQAFKQRGYALLSGKVGYVPVSKRAAVLIKTPEDLRFAEALLAGQAADAVAYDPRATTVMRGVAA